MEIVLALLSALLFAWGTVMQQKAGLQEPALVEKGSRAGLLLRVARQPLWLAGVAVEGLGFAAQAVALTIGDLTIVQPLLMSTVVFALPIAARVTGQRVHKIDLLAALVVMAALVAFLLVCDPSGGRNGAAPGEWLVAGATLAGAACLLAALAQKRTGPARKAALLGSATGLLFGLNAALTKVVGDALAHGGVAEVFLHWQVYALALVGYVSLTFNQLSLQTGALAPAVATSIAADPIVSVILGMTLFREVLRTTTAGAVGGLAALAVALAGIAVLARTQEHESGVKLSPASRLPVADSG